MAEVTSVERFVSDVPHQGKRASKHRLHHSDDVPLRQTEILASSRPHPVGKEPDKRVSLMVESGRKRRHVQMVVIIQRRNEPGKV